MVETQKFETEHFLKLLKDVDEFGSCLLLGLEVDLNLLKKKSTGYAAAKNVAIKEASNILDIENIKNIQKAKELIGDVVEKVANDWQVQKQTLYKQTGLGDNGCEKELEQLLLEQQPHDRDSNQV